MSLPDAFNDNSPPAPDAPDMQNAVPPDENGDENASADAQADDWYGLDAAGYPGMRLPADGTVYVVRGMMPLPVADSPGLEQHRDAIEAALLILSQSATGRALLQTAIDAGYAIHLDPPVIGGAGPENEEDANASADHENRRINMRGLGDAHALALNLGHELAHISQFVDGGLDIHIRDEHPGSALKKLLAMEGDARAHEILIAMELQYGEKDSPEGRLLFPGMIEKAVEGMGIPMVAKLMQAVAPKLPDGIAPDKVMAGVFMSFYTAPGLRRHYEDTILHMIEKQAVEDLKNPAMFRGETAATDIMARLDAAMEARRAQTGAVPYLQKNAAEYIDLDAPTQFSVSAQTQERLDRLAAIRHENPETAHDKPWRLPVYNVAPLVPKTPAQKPPALKHAAKGARP